jgi:DNA polymerase I
MSISSLQGKLISYDTETTGLNPWNSAIYKKYGMKPARPFAFSFFDAFGNSAYIRWEVNPKNREVIQNKQEAKEISDLLGDPNITKVGHNLSFDIRMTRLSNMRFNWIKVHDTMFMARILTGGSFFSYGLKPISKLWLGIKEDDLNLLMKSVLKARNIGRKSGWAISNEETHGSKHTKSDLWLGDSKLCKEYSINDAKRTILLYLGMSKVLNTEPELVKIYNTEIRLMREVYRAENRGVRVIPSQLKSLEKFYLDYRNKWRLEVEAQGGKGINLNSPMQLVNLFCIQRKYSTKKRTDAGRPSIDASELARLAKKDQLAKAILEYKVGESMITKFINSYNKFMTPQGINMVLHPSFHQMGTNTARFSCSDPNLEQVAAEDSAKKKADIGLRPREAIGARPGHVLYLPDYSQMEVWVFAFKAKDPILMKALLNGEDIHAAVATSIWGDRPDWEENFKLYRKKGKTMVFLKQYGGGITAASELLDCSKDEAQETIDEFDYRFPGVNMFIESMSRKAEEQGYIENAFGRQYYINVEFSYKAVNYYVQGTCADVIKRAMIRLAYYFRKQCQPTTRWLIPLHDELYIEVHHLDHSTKLQKKIISFMQMDSNKIGIPVPLPVKMKISEDLWSNAKEIEL